MKMSIFQVKHWVCSASQQPVWFQAKPVSYTHLDVYKRQISIFIGMMTLNWCWGWCIKPWKISKKGIRKRIISFTLFTMKQKTAYEMRESDWSSDVCSSDLKMGFRPEIHLFTAVRSSFIITGRIMDIKDFFSGMFSNKQIGRASCRERVYVLV